MKSLINLSESSPILQSLLEKNNTMSEPIINFDEFVLPFSSISTEVYHNDENSKSDSDMEDGEDLDISEVKGNMESSIPKEAIYIG